MPADGRYPILFLTGMSFARSAEEQERWQSFHDQTMAKLLASLARSKTTNPMPKSSAVKNFMADNLFAVASA